MNCDVTTGQRGMGFITGGSVIMGYGFIFWAEETI